MLCYLAQEKSLLEIELLSEKEIKIYVSRRFMKCVAVNLIISYSTTVLYILFDFTIDFLPLNLHPFDNESFL